MERFSIVLFVIALSGCSTIGESSRYSATVTRNCGYTDGGGYDITIDMAERDVSIHTEGSPSGGEWRLDSGNLRILVCDRRLNQCTKPASGFLKLSRKTHNRLNGNISFELSGQNETIDFRGLIQNPDEQFICG